jgi:hypothetical protein
VIAFNFYEEDRQGGILNGVDSNVEKLLKNL